MLSKTFQRNPKYLAMITWATWPITIDIVIVNICWGKDVVILRKARSHIEVDIEQKFIFGRSIWHSRKRLQDAHQVRKIRLLLSIHLQPRFWVDKGTFSKSFFRLLLTASIVLRNLCYGSPVIFSESLHSTILMIHNNIF
jgi:hypothetical protein